MVKTILWVLFWYYVPSYLLIGSFLHFFMKKAYSIEGVPVPWKLHLKLVAIPFVGFWLSALTLFVDFSNHLANQESRAYEASKRKNEENM